MSVGVGACASRLRPNARLKRFPATTGDMHRKPQFCEKWSVKNDGLVVQGSDLGTERLTKTKALDYDGRE